VSKVARRDFILTAGMAGAGAFAFGGFASRAAFLGQDGGGSPSTDAIDYGPLFPARTNNTGEMLLALPKGFQYTVFGKTGARMTDGHATPRAHDGMAAFHVKNQLRLVRNHEVNTPVGKAGAAIGPNAYDPFAGGGTTTLVIDTNTRELVKDFVSLSGTLINCAGGRTPWNTWISCEETLLGPDRFKNDSGQDQGGFAKHHGYCFEVAAAADGPVDPIPLKAMGRFQHEAIAVDPKTGIVYLTEDRPRAGFYRFIPARPGKFAAGGRLQMLAVKGRPNLDTRTQQTAGARLNVTWVDIPNPDPAEAERDDLAVYKQGIAAGAATFARLEGCLYGNERIYFDSTSGGDKKLGQVWEYRPTGKEQGTLTLLFESGDPSILNMPDNLCLNRTGNVVICEDNGVSIHLRVMNQAGQLGTLARNIFEGFENREFAGVTFSPDYKTLFVNIQVPGLTFAIWGPW
jgi:secreted PhoX family phosphatase